ncbi:MULTISPECIES: hypothetical protein [Bacillus]|uniref:hypothetical protein n=1 Tax=Bacillus TaxID=1386 RepID=UPI000A4C0138|nr:MULTISPECIES: hypothetical protein [Bacillus cereus group]RAT02435.1 hypothetical protein A6E22_19810 [Bacillus cereus]MCU5208569.1 hypothetical protein [Bacillus paranthracis]MDA2160892.1 hypothetical protein [Bacillus cereus group sp. Bc252]MDF9512452.1 hypothetical protein [Bacillus paranthracis]MDF9670523.1 hypothetical protein [Bacillus paranthracis]
MRVQGDHNLLNPLESVMPVRTALGDSEWTRMVVEIRLYERYNGDLNVCSNYKKTDNLDYEPTKIQLDYPQKIVNMIAAWRITYLCATDIVAFYTRDAYNCINYLHY